MINRNGICMLILLIFSPQAFSDTNIYVGFSPCWNGRSCALTIVVNSINEAKAGKQLLMAAYGLTSKPIEDALVDAFRRGVEVRIVVDQKSNRKAVLAKRLEEIGIPVRYNDRYAIMHNKFIVIGSDLVETGSFNFTTAASTRNAENVILIRGNHDLAMQYAAEWNRLWDEADPNPIQGE